MTGQEEPVEPPGEVLLGHGGFPPDARRMGIDRFSDDAALIAFAASLDPEKRLHKVMAWVLLTVMVAPLVLNLGFQLARGW